jgi:hypothetical protein
MEATSQVTRRRGQGPGGGRALPASAGSGESQSRGSSEPPAGPDQFLSTDLGLVIG